MNSHVPLHYEEILADVAQALALGVQMVHLHARDNAGIQTADPAPYGRLVEAIRALPGGRELIVGVTTSGRQDAGFESRSRVLELDGLARPDMASLTFEFAQLRAVSQRQRTGYHPPTGRTHGDKRHQAGA